MNRQIITFPGYERQEIEYRIINVATKSERSGNGMFPVICLYEKGTDKCIYPTKWSLYLLHHLQKDNAFTTIEKAAKALKEFLNYLLHEESVIGIHEVNRELLRRYCECIKTKRNQSPKPGEEITPDYWGRCVNEVYLFLENYLYFHEGEFEFQYKKEDLHRVELVTNPMNRRTTTVSRRVHVTENVKEKPKKCRYLPENLKEVWIWEVKKHNPSLLLPNLIQFDSGIREGEIVNIARNKIHVPTGVGEIVVDLTEKPEFSRSHRGKTPIGAIKNYRDQKVYPDFTREVKEAYRQHLILEDIKFRKLGRQIDPEGPLFTNTRGNPLTEARYNQMCKELFENHFVPDLERYCLAVGEYDTNKFLLDAYKQEFIGCHAFRHWFTMYLLCHRKLDQTEVMVWRGDRCQTSMLDYVHVNQEMIQNFEKVSFHFQAEMMEAIYSGNMDYLLQKRGKSTHDSE